MIWVILLLFLVGLFLSALFSGSEMGLYRVPRVRLLIDAMGGDRISRGLLWLTGRPSLFVATTLVGNNLANYFTSLAIVMGVHYVLVDSGAWAEIVAPIALAPVLFVYGEHLPKTLFYKAPNRLLRLAAPVFGLCTILFLPVSALLWVVSKFLEWALGESPQRMQRRLARKELTRVLDEGHEVGLLRPAQRRVAQGLFAIASRPLAESATPAARVAKIRRGAHKDHVLRLARRLRLTEMLVESDDRVPSLVGYVRTADLYLNDAKQVEEVQPLMKLAGTEPHIAALMLMQAADQPLAEVVDHAGETLGIVTLTQLTEPLFRAGA